MQTFSDVIEAFEGPTRFAAAIGIEPFHAQTMKNRGSIPPAYWTRVVDAAAREGKAVTLETLAHIAARKAEPVETQAEPPADAPKNTEQEAA